MDYKGEKCQVCGEIFTDDDDIVVCPECGTPHHRSCYITENRCANEGYHSTGRKWERTVHKKPLYKVCPVCNFPNRVTDSNCQRCGAEINDISVVSMNENNAEHVEDNIQAAFSADQEAFLDPIKYLGLDPDEDMGGASMQEVTDFVGPSTIYYLPKFKRMKDDGTKPSFNFFSLIFPTLYFANRKMWGWAILAAVLGVLLNLPADLLLYIEEFPDSLATFISNNKSMIQAVSDICLVADIGVRALFCLFANWLYFRFAMNSLKKHKTSGRSASSIKAEGGIKPMNMLIITAIKYGIGLIVLAALYYGFEMATTIKDFSTLCLM